MDSWEDCVPWRDEKHVGLSLSTDASGHGWGCVLHLPFGDQEFRDYWDQQQLEFNISTKEMLALVNSLKALPTTIKDCRIDVDVDSRVLIDAWEGQGSKGSPQLTKATKDLSFELTLSERNLQFRLSHVKSGNNPADGPSRRLSGLDSRLSDETWSLVEQTFGGTSGHSFDLMALDSNSVIGRSGSFYSFYESGFSGRQLIFSEFTGDRGHIESECFSAVWFGGSGFKVPLQFPNSVHHCCSRALSVSVLVA